MNKLNSKQWLFLLLVVFVLFFVVFARGGEIKQGKTEGPTAVFFAFVDKLRMNNSIPKSNLEWFGRMTLETSDFLTSLVTTTGFEGTVVKVNQESGKVKIPVKHYYVGSPGYYTYDGEIVVEGKNGAVTSFFYSPARMEIMKVNLIESSLAKPITFSDIQPGDRIEIFETVDLVKDNVDDANLISLIVNVYR